MQKTVGSIKVRPDCVSPATQIRLAADVYRCYSTSDDDSGCILDEYYSWIPSGGLKPDDVHSYFASLPNEKIPFLNSVGEKWRITQLKYQLPSQDSEPSDFLTDSERQELQRFDASRKKECLGRGQIQRLPYDSSKRYCHQCKKTINADELIVGAQRLGERAFWHPACFVCVECKELLVELIYYKHEDNVFCGRHHAELLKPRCAHCDELIFSDECVEAEGRVWHMMHFACTLCSCQLGGMKYVMRSEKPFCVPCYQQSSVLSCNRCKRRILIDQPRITQGDLHWHNNSKCFGCTKCGRNLLGKNYTLNESALLCGQDDCEYRASKKSSSRNEVASTIVDPKTPSRVVRFDFPEPPINSPPLPPVQLNQTPPENIYETLSEIQIPSRRKSRRRPNKFRHHSDEDLDSSSIASFTSSADECCNADANISPRQLIKMRMKQKKTEAHTRKHQQRRSLSMDGCSSRLCHNNPTEEVPLDQLSLRQKQQRTKKRSTAIHQNYYSGMPPEFTTQRSLNYSYTSTSESDSDDDIYLNFSATMTPPQYMARQQQIKLYSSSKSNRTPARPYNSKRRHRSVVQTPRLSKNSERCIFM